MDRIDFALLFFFSFGFYWVRRGFVCGCWRLCLLVGDQLAGADQLAGGWAGLQSN